MKILLQPWNSRGINELSGEVRDLTRGESSGQPCRTYDGKAVLA